MEKIKSVLHGHKKEDNVTHDSHTSSSTAEGQQHPIYDQMTHDEGQHHGHSTVPGEPHYNVKTTSGAPYTDLAQPSGSAGLHAHDAHGRPEHVGTDGPIGSSTITPSDHHNSSHTHDYASTERPIESTGTVAAARHRPDAHPHGHAQEASVASIKSGVIGFGPGQHQGHAAIGRHNPTEEYMDSNQVVGGGNPGTAGMTEGSRMAPTTGGESYPQTSALGSDSARADPTYSREQQPYENTLRQESYTADTDRSFPLAGGVVSRHHDGPSSSTRHPTEQTSPIHNKNISEREPDMKEREMGIHDNNSKEGYGRGGLAGAAAAATAYGTSKTLSRPKERDVKDQGLDTRQATYGDVASTAPQAGSTSSQQTSNYHPGALAAATAAASRSSQFPQSAQGQEYGVQDHGLPDMSQTASTTAPVSGMSNTSGRPQNQRLESHNMHIPGAFVATPGDETRTFLDYTPVIDPTASDITSETPITQPTSTLDPSTQGSNMDPAPDGGHHELRHTGTLDEPQPRSSDDHHFGRDAAIAGGLGAGVAGLGAHAASRRQETPEASSSQPLYEESSPYSSATLDPRVMGQKAKLDEQRFDPQARSSNPASNAATSGPPVSHATSQREEPQHHYGRDAAALGTGAVAAGGIHHALQRNDTPGTGTTVLPEESGTAPQQASNFSKPLPTAGSVPQQRSVGNDTFYGVTGAPAPVADTSVHHQQPSSNYGYTADPTAVSERQPEHHYGRNAGLAGAGAAAAGGLYAANRDSKADSGPDSNTIGPHSNNAANIMDPRAQPDPSKQAHHNVGSTAEDPASRTIGPHSSNVANILDPRVKPDPSKQKEHTTTGPHQSDTLNRLDPKVDEKAVQQGEHHYGRDAAVVGGTGAAGYGAYEAVKAYGDHRMTQPEASLPEQRYDPTASSARAPNPVSATSNYDYNDPSTQRNVNRTDPNDHVNRNTALGGAGLVAAGLGAGAYAGSRHTDNTQELPLHQKQGLPSSGQPGSLGQSSYPTQGMTESLYPQSTAQSAYPTTGTVAPHNTHNQGLMNQQPYGVTQEPANENHNKRNAAVLGGAVGAAGLGGAAYVDSQHQDEREAEERLQKLAHEREKEQAKEQHKLDKEQAKHDKEVLKHDKAVAAHEKEEARLAKDHEKDEHRLMKEHEKEQARLAKEQHQREKELEKENEGEEKKKHGFLSFLHRDKSKKEKSASPESSPRQSRDYSPRHSLDENNPDSPRWKGKHLLHKDPPKGHPAREAMEHQHETVDPYGHAGKREHQGIDGPIGDPNMISGDRETRKGVYGAHPTSDLDHPTTVTEPHTGLPMNIERYGTGAGGIDGNSTIHGHHAHGGATGQSGTDWEAIRKADTPY